MSDNQPSGEPPVSDGVPVDDSFVALFSRLVDDGEHFVRAELRLYRAQLFARLKQARLAILMIVGAFLLGQSAIVALLVGLVATLRQPLGPAGATAVVVLGALTVAGLLGWIAIGLLRRATDVKDRRK